MPPSVKAILKPTLRDIGSLEVRRVLPALAARLVGPFIFFDHMGPASYAPGTGVDVRPHPHIGLATVTYLFEGAMLHRDSLGSVQKITPGDVNWMTAGRGIVHSERTPDEERRHGQVVHGIQTWVALPLAHETDEPSFEHHTAAKLPQIERNGVTLTVIAGSAFGFEAPTRTYSPTLYVAANFAPNDFGITTMVAKPNASGDVWVADGNAVYHSTNSGASWTKLSGFATVAASGSTGALQGASRIALGKAQAGSSYSAAVYVVGTMNGVWGVYHSDDGGATWARFNDDAHQYGGIGAIAGDWNTYGRIYFSGAGRGLIYTN